MSKYRKKPVVIDAFRYNHDPEPDWFRELNVVRGITLLGNYCLIQTPEGDMKAMTGDYIIRGIKGEIYPCKADIFSGTYEAVVEGEQVE